MEKEHRIVKLPTGALTNIKIRQGKLQCWYGDEIDFLWSSKFTDNVYQYLHLISDDEIKVGDWFLFELTELKQATQETVDYLNSSGDTDSHKKVVASSDTDLNKCEGCKRSEKSTDAYTCSCPSTILPGFETYFIMEYVKAGGLDRVVVKMEDGELRCTNCGRSEFTCLEEKECQTLTRKEGIKIKNNQVIIQIGKSPKQKLIEAIGDFNEDSMLKFGMDEVPIQNNAKLRGLLSNLLDIKHELMRMT